MNEMFSQGGKGSTGILTNKQAVARHFGVKQSEVVYFSVDAVLTGYKVIYDKESQRAYSLPADIGSGVTAVSLSSAGVLVHSAGNVDLGALAVAREEYVTLPGSFDTGVTVNAKNELVVFTDGKYRWDGALPKEVPADSTPASTGDVGSGAWVSVGDASFRSELTSTASGKGASLIAMSPGVSVRDAITRIDNKIFTPEDFGCNSAAADNTDAVNAALTSGKPVLWTESKVYRVTGHVQASKDVYDLHLGTMVLETTRYSLGQVKVIFADKVQESDPIRGMYVESAYDFCELAFIKGLGINTIIHYGNFNVSVDSDGSLTKVADNIRALGMRLMVNTEVRDVKDPTLTLAQFIQKFNNHPAVFAWSTFDEAMSRGISYEAQKSQYDEIRNYSNKPISIVDAWYNTNVISNKILDYYDIVMANPYAQVHAGKTTQEAIQADLKYMRRCYGAMQAHSRQKKVIPVLGLCVGNGSPGATDQVQIIGAAENFRRAGNGQFVFFVWDGLGDPGAIISAIRGNAQFISCVKSTVEKKYPVPVITESILYGGNGTIGHQPLNNIIDRLPVRDQNTSDSYIGGNAYPIHIFGGASVNTDRGITNPGWNISGIGFKGTTATLVTNIPFRKNVVVYGDYSTVDTGVLDGSFQVLGTFDGGYSSNLRASQDTSGSYAAINLHATTPDPNERICIKTVTVTDTNIYRRIKSGIIISCDW